MSDASESRIASKATKASATGAGVVSVLIAVVTYLGDRTLDAQTEALQHVADAVSESREEVRALRESVVGLSHRVEDLEGHERRIRELEASVLRLQVELGRQRPP